MWKLKIERHAEKGRANWIGKVEEIWETRKREWGGEKESIFLMLGGRDTIDKRKDEERFT